MSKRKGARTIKSIDPQILENLSLGLIESSSLVETLAIDFVKLAQSLNLKIDKIEQQGIIKKMLFVSSKINDWQKFSQAKSDTVRGLCAFALANKSDLNFTQKLEFMQQFAQDSHFGVREWAWLAMRNEVIQNLDLALIILTKWSLSKNENIRRFACEVTRPRGVWCAHIVELKTNPQKALAILENLKSDQSRYVQNSLGNWLNDAGKNNPDFVRNLVKRWQKISPTKETSYIIKRALRNLN